MNTNTSKPGAVADKAPVATLLFVRHGSTHWTSPPSRYQGRTDVPLSARGRSEVKELADRLHAVKLDAIYSSPLSRARETAAGLVADRCSPSIDIDKRIVELSYGHWEGRRHADVAEDDAEALRAWADDGASPPGGESRASLLRRVSDFLNDIVGQGTVAVVTHKEVIRASAIALGLLRPAEYLVLELPCASIFSAVGEPGAWVCPPDIACELSGV